MYSFIFLILTAVHKQCMEQESLELFQQALPHIILQLFILKYKVQISILATHNSLLSSWVFLFLLEVLIKVSANSAFRFFLGRILIFFFQVCAVREDYQGYDKVLGLCICHIDDLERVCNSQCRRQQRDILQIACKEGRAQLSVSYRNKSQVKVLSL